MYMGYSGIDLLRFTTDPARPRAYGPGPNLSPVRSYFRSWHRPSYAWGGRYAYSRPYHLHGMGNGMRAENIKDPTPIKPIPEMLPVAADELPRTAAPQLPEDFTYAIAPQIPPWAAWGALGLAALMFLTQRRA